MPISTTLKSLNFSRIFNTSNKIEATGRELKRIAVTDIYDWIVTRYSDSQAIFYTISARVRSFALRREKFRAIRFNSHVGTMMFLV